MLSTKNSFQIQQNRQVESKNGKEYTMQKLMKKKQEWYVNIR